MITFEQIKQIPEINVYIQAGNDALAAIGFTDHGFAHVTLTAERASKILKDIYKKPTVSQKREIELVKIAGYLHDIGNMINRTDHAISGATVAFTLLSKLAMDPSEIALICSAIGNHDEEWGKPVNNLTAALILADKSDVRFTRVRNSMNLKALDIHDRVNFAVKSSEIKIDNRKKHITLSLEIDTNISPVMDYFEIFISRMIMCKRASEKFDMHFKLNINGNEIL